MKLICLNTWGGKVLNPLKNFISNKKDDIDIFCFQEIFKGGNAKNPEEFTNVNETNLSLYEDIEKILVNYNGYFCPVHENYYGLAVFTKKELEILENKDILIYENKNFPDKENSLADHTRKIQYLKIKNGDDILNVINVHGHWVSGNKLDNPNRIKQSEIILSLIQSLSEPTVLCGDFNIRPDTESIKMIDRKMRNLINEYNITSTRTPLHKKADKHADYIFLSFNVKLEDFKVLEDVVSDHLALSLEIK